MMCICVRVCVCVCVCIHTHVYDPIYISSGTATQKLLIKAMEFLRS
jgi:hypothetical protein